MDKKAFYINLLLSFLTVLLFSFSFPSPSISFLAWIALVPWFIIISSGYKVGLFSYIIGASFFALNLSWLRFVTYPGWLLLSLYLAAYLLAFGVISHYLRKRLKLPHIIIAPFAWVALEYLRSFPLSGFPWFFMGHSQYLNLPLIQFADITGVYGVSFLVITFNAAIADLIGQSLVKGKFKLGIDSIISFGKKRNFYYFTIIIPILLVCLALLYGYFSLKRYKSLQNGPNICVIQGNIPQDIKIDPGEKRQEEILRKYVSLSLNNTKKNIDLFIWPETMVPGILNIDPLILDRNIDRLSKKSIQMLANATSANLLVGGTAIDINNKYPQYFNTAFYFNRKGKLIDRYDKIHLVPFGEFIPFEDYLRFLGHLVPYEVSLSSGKRRTVFELVTDNTHEVFKFGVIICYEDTVASLVRKFRKDGVDFMVNITNDAWFCDSSELDQHLAVMVFRAVENRICITRAANTGISSFVAPGGEIYDYLVRNGKYREIDGVLNNKIRFVDTTNTWYTNHGDVFAISCLVITTMLLLITLTRRIFA
ncbi:MAG: apolipoprotein N-acyltransferase [Candidatus Scalinduaceae bacterium]